MTNENECKILQKYKSTNEEINALIMHFLKAWLSTKVVSQIILYIEQWT